MAVDSFYLLSIYLIGFFIITLKTNEYEEN
jgi:hypothetical protein